ncbi:MAG: copper chaperone [Tannerella sp.]|jgi:Cu(I)/Ag(I) efflux system membrane fusion protein|nr:copper chaperone [Tannerella sp.]
MKQIRYLFAAVIITVALGGCSNASSKKAESSDAAAQHSDEHVEMTVGGSCGMCKERIEKTAKAVEGVATAEWDQSKQQLHLHIDAGKTSREAISKALAAVGHDTELDKAPDEVYDALPDCCKYR